MSQAFEDYMRAQRSRIDVDKWNKGIEIGSDPGAVFVMDWIKTRAKQYRYDYVNEKINEAIEIVKRLEQQGADPSLIEECLRKLEAAKELVEKPAPASPPAPPIPVIEVKEEG